MKEPPLSKLQKDVLKLIAEIREERKRNKMSYKIIEALKSINYKDLLMRAFWTFLQAFLAVVILAGESLVDLLFNGDWGNFYVLLLATCLAGLAAGLSAVKTIVLETIRQLNAVK